MNIAEKLLYIQQNLKTPKTQRNTFGDYNYRSCEDIQEAVKPLLKEVKAVLLLTDDIKQVGDRFYIMATATLKDVESDEVITNNAYAREAENKPKMDAAQITGSCSSYARKYALNGLFCIDDAKDPDTMNYNEQSGQQVATQSGKQTAAYGIQHTASQNRHQEVAPAQPVTKNHIKTLISTIEKHGAKKDMVLANYHLQRFEDMTLAQFRHAIQRLEEMPTVEELAFYQETMFRQEEVKEI